MVWGASIRVNLGRPDTLRTAALITCASTRSRRSSGRHEPVRVGLCLKRLVGRASWVTLRLVVPSPHELGATRASMPCRVRARPSRKRKWTSRVRCPSIDTPRNRMESPRGSGGPHASRWPGGSMGGNRPWVELQDRPPHPGLPAQLGSKPVPSGVVGPWGCPPVEPAGRSFRF